MSEINKQFISEILINAVLLNEYDSILRSMLIRICNHLSISYLTFLSLEHKLLKCLHIVISSLSKEQSKVKEKAKNVNVLSTKQSLQ